MNELFPTEPTGPYRVLARKYRPVNFAELVGQEALVRTLTNAIRTGRIAHAFILTGVRGIGKTTTARIIARALNCVGPDGAGGPSAGRGPTIEPCGVCEHCTAIAQDRHVDVIEMDAASRTGVDDIRDLIEGVQYRPVRARYKVYIIDEVHMLSKNAFNALLKTLEEPPEHVKFVFATTEIRKVPITVLSRCQRFDLRRLDREQLVAHLSGIAAKESAKIDADAIALLARAADGSVRDGLSLLDRAIAEADPAAGPISAEQVRAMLGLADRGQTLDLFELAMKGAIAETLNLARTLYRAGADPLTLVQDLLAVTHEITRLKLVAEQAALDLSASEAARAKPMAEKLGVPALSRAWQMLLKGVSEIQAAPQPMSALEMLLVRLAHVADLPTPGEIVARLQSEGAGTAAAPRTGASVPGGPTRPASAVAAVPAPAAPRPNNGGPRAALAQQPHTQAQAPAPGAVTELRDFADLVQLFAEKREAMLHAHLTRDVHLVRFEAGRLEFRPGERAPTNLSNRVGELLTAWTGRRWIVSVSNQAGEATLRDQSDARKADAHARALEHPVVRKALALFPEAKVSVKTLDAATAEPPPAAAAETEGDAPPPPEEYPPDYAGSDEEDFA